MTLIHQLLIFLHIVTAAAWFGLGLRLARQARSSDRAVVEDAWRGVNLMGWMLWLTFAFSMGILLLGGGYPGRVEFHVASLLIVVLLALHYAVLRPNWRKLLQDDPAPSGAAGRIAMASGMGHLIWVALLTLMLWNRLAAAV